MANNMDETLVEDWLNDWAKWMKNNRLELKELDCKVSGVWREVQTNYMSGEDDADIADDRRHDGWMRIVDASVNTLGDNNQSLKCVIYQVYGLGTMGMPAVPDQLLGVMFNIAKVRLGPILTSRGIVI